MNEDFEDFEDFDYLDIDLDQLEIELVRQPREFNTQSKRLAEARKRAATATAYLELVKADAGKKIRERPLKYGLEKVTEDAIKGAIVLSKEYQEAKRREIQAEYLVNMLSGAVETLRQRKTMVEKSIELLLSGFFSDVRIPKGDNSRDYAERAKTKTAFTSRRRSES